MAAAEHLIDTGPLVALIDGSDRDHEWSKKTLGGLRCPLITCEAVLSEVLFLLRNDEAAPQKVGTLFARGLLISFPVMDAHFSGVFSLMQTYQNIPMSLADASLVKISEHLPNATIVTLDSDFLVYRKHRNKAISTLMPPRIKL